MRSTLILTCAVLLLAAGCSSVAQHTGTKSVIDYLGGRWDSDGLYPFESDQGVGFIDASGNIKIPAREIGRGSARNKGVTLFAEGLAPLMDATNKFGYIDKTGKFAIAPQFDKAGQFRDGFALVTVENGQFAYIDHQGKRLNTPPLYSAAPFSEGLAAVCVGDFDHKKWGYIDTTGKLVIPAQFDFADRFSEGLAATGSGKKNGFIDKTGKVRIETGEQAGIYFSEGLAQITDSLSTAAKCGYLDTTGKLVVRQQWPCMQTEPFHEGLARVYEPDRGTIGYIDRTGALAVPYQFADGGSFSAGRAPVQPEVGGKWGYIDASGKLVIEAKFDRATPFFPAGIALVMSGLETRYIDVNGKYIWNASQQ